MPVLKGAFIRLDNDLLGALPIIVVFQFNPEKITRTPSVPATAAATATPAPTASNARQVASEPAETIGFSLRLDATDQLAASNPVAVASGILPTLSALELLMAPTTPVAADLASLSGGNGPHQNPSALLPMVLFFWGPYRILPVKFKSMSIDETRFDTRLSPVRADVTISLEVLTPDALAGETFARGVYKYTKGVKEVMAALSMLNAAEMGVSASLSLSL
ncbi:MAG TPA: hypothetical protein VJZ00_01860 [Thermoanaerobaculia bacterium]|nr:hypothetical protein [Thermoanaerobaculia bacterium]